MRTSKEYKSENASLFLKAVAAVLIFCFITTSVSTPTLQASVVDSPSAGRRSIDVRSIQQSIISGEMLDEELGIVEEHFDIARVNDGDQLVIVVQNAHANEDSETHTLEIIRQFQTDFQLPLVLLEGGEGVLDSLLFKTFPNRELSRSILLDYLNRGDLSGAEVSAILSESDQTHFYGIDSQSLYEENTNAFLRAMSKEAQVVRKIEDLEWKLAIRAEAELTEKAFTWLEKRRKYESEKLSLLDYLEVILESREKVLLETSSPEIAKIWHERNRIQAKNETSAEAVLRNWIKALEKDVLRELGREKQSLVNGLIQSYRLELIGRGKFVNDVEEILKTAGLEVLIPDALQIDTKDARSLASIKGTKLFEELDALEVAFADEVSRNDVEKDLIRQNLEVRVLHDFTRLEILPKYWQSVKGCADADEVVSCDLSLLEANRSLLLPLLEDHFKFYQLAEERDQALFENALRVMRAEESPVALIVVGGFHTKGLTRRLESSGISHVVISPRIDEIDDRMKYMGAMKGERSFMKYYDGNLWQALARDYASRVSASLATRDQLASLGVVSNAQSGLALKRWRDQIIQRSSENGTITKVAEYTRYVDAVAKARYEILHSSLSEDELRASIRAELDSSLGPYFDKLEQLVDLKFDAISNGFKDLWEKKDFSREGFHRALNHTNEPAKSNLAVALALIKDPGLKVLPPKDILRTVLPGHELSLGEQERVLRLVPQVHTDIQTVEPQPRPRLAPKLRGELPKILGTKDPETILRKLAQYRRIIESRHVTSVREGQAIEGVDPDAPDNQGGVWLEDGKDRQLRDRRSELRATATLEFVVDLESNLREVEIVHDGTTSRIAIVKLDLDESQMQALDHATNSKLPKGEYVVLGDEDGLHSLAKLGRVNLSDLSEINDAEFRRYVRETNRRLVAAKAEMERQTGESVEDAKEPGTRLVLEFYPLQDVRSDAQAQKFFDFFNQVSYHSDIGEPVVTYLVMERSIYHIEQIAVFQISDPSSGTIFKIEVHYDDSGLRDSDRAELRSGDLQSVVQARVEQAKELIASDINIQDIPPELIPARLAKLYNVIRAELFQKLLETTLEGKLNRKKMSGVQIHVSIDVKQGVDYFANPGAHVPFETAQDRDARSPYIQTGFIFPVEWRGFVRQLAEIITLAEEVGDLVTQLDPDKGTLSVMGRQIGFDMESRIPEEQAVVFLDSAWDVLRRAEGGSNEDNFFDLLSSDAGREKLAKELLHRAELRTTSELPDASLAALEQADPKHVGLHSRDWVKTQARRAAAYKDSVEKSTERTELRSIRKAFTIAFALASIIGLSVLPFVLKRDAVQPPEKPEKPAVVKLDGIKERAPPVDQSEQPGEQEVPTVPQVPSKPEKPPTSPTAVLVTSITTPEQSIALIAREAGVKIEPERALEVLRKMQKLKTPYDQIDHVTLEKLRAQGIVVDRNLVRSAEAIFGEKGLGFPLEGPNTLTALDWAYMYLDPLILATDLKDRPAHRRAFLAELEAKAPLVVREVKKLNIQSDLEIPRLWVFYTDEMPSNIWAIIGDKSSIENVKPQTLVGILTFYAKVNANHRFLTEKHSEAAQYFKFHLYLKKNYFPLLKLSLNRNPEKISRDDLIELYSKNNKRGLYGFYPAIGEHFMNEYVFYGEALESLKVRGAYVRRDVRNYLFPFFKGSEGDVIGSRDIAEIIMRYVYTKGSLRPAGARGVTDLVGVRSPAANEMFDATMIGVRELLHSKPYNDFYKSFEDPVMYHLWLKWKRRAYQFISKDNQFSKARVPELIPRALLRRVNPQKVEPDVWQVVNPFARHTPALEDDVFKAEHIFMRKVVLGQATRPVNRALVILGNHVDRHGFIEVNGKKRIDTNAINEAYKIYGRKDFQRAISRFYFGNPNTLNPINPDHMGAIESVYEIIYRLHTERGVSIDDATDSVIILLHAGSDQEFQENVRKLFSGLTKNDAWNELDLLNQRVGPVQSGGIQQTTLGRLIDGWDRTANRVPGAVVLVNDSTVYQELRDGKVIPHTIRDKAIEFGIRMNRLMRGDRTPFKPGDIKKFETDPFFARTYTGDVVAVLQSVVDLGGRFQLESWMRNREQSLRLLERGRDSDLFDRENDPFRNELRPELSSSGTSFGTGRSELRVNQPPDFGRGAYKTFKIGGRDEYHNVTVRKIHTETVPFKKLGRFTLDQLTFQIVERDGRPMPLLQVWLEDGWQDLPDVTLEDGFPIVIKRGHKPARIDPVHDTDLEGKIGIPISDDDYEYLKRPDGSEWRIVIFWKNSAGEEKRTFLPRSAHHGRLSRGSERGKDQNRPAYDMNTETYIDEYPQEGHLEVELMEAGAEGVEVKFADLGSTYGSTIEAKEGWIQEKGSDLEKSLLRQMMIGDAMGTRMFGVDSLVERPVVYVPPNQVVELPYETPFFVAAVVRGEEMARTHYFVKNRRVLHASGNLDATWYPATDNVHFASQPVPTAGQSAPGPHGGSRVAKGYRVRYIEATNTIEVANFTAHKLRVAAESDSGSASPPLRQELRTEVEAVEVKAQGFQQGEPIQLNIIFARGGTIEGSKTNSQVYHPDERREYSGTVRTILELGRLAIKTERDDRTVLRTAIHAVVSFLIETVDVIAHLEAGDFDRLFISTRFSKKLPVALIQPHIDSGKVVVRDSIGMPRMKESLMPVITHKFSEREERTELRIVAVPLLEQVDAATKLSKLLFEAADESPDVFRRVSIDGLSLEEVLAGLNGLRQERTQVISKLRQDVFSRATDQLTQAVQDVQAAPDQHRLNRIIDTQFQSSFERSGILIAHVDQLPESEVFIAARSRAAHGLADLLQPAARRTSPETNVSEAVLPSQEAFAIAREIYEMLTTLTEDQVIDLDLRVFGNELGEDGFAGVLRGAIDLARASEKLHVEITHAESLEFDIPELFGQVRNLVAREAQVRRLFNADQITFPNIAASASPHLSITKFETDSREAASVLNPTESPRGRVRFVGAGRDVISPEFALLLGAALLSKRTVEGIQQLDQRRYQLGDLNMARQVAYALQLMLAAQEAITQSA